MKYNKKIKGLLMVGILITSTISMVGCTTNANNSSEQKTQTEEKNTNESSESKNSENNDTSKEASDKEKESTQNNEANKTESGKAEITYYTYDINSEKLTEHKQKADEVSVGNVIKALVSEKVLQKGTDVNKAKVETVDGVRTLIVDVNDKFVNFDLGSSAETLMLRSFTNSLIKTFKVEQVKLTVDGKSYSSGHIVIKDGEYLKFK
ncbi:GerMN domain-containing protein [Peptostreptococcus sp. D1]|uniref:GerMN domain-containing protein n=1 Tax=Peptostreptococcus sp. D1 TaxID=72304 RepID=UPI0008F3B144|nr:GerMN domain-containing protein [Peptostreptococcus sp. D1]SFE68246.1 Sporulation and spore germination [Peptostreptococcus sp. D1]